VTVPAVLLVLLLLAVAVWTALSKPDH